MKRWIAVIVATYAIQLVFFAYHYRAIGFTERPGGPSIIYGDPNWAVAWWLAIPLTVLVAAVSAWFRTSRRNPDHPTSHSRAEGPWAMKKWIAAIVITAYVIQAYTAAMYLSYGWGGQLTGWIMHIPDGPNAPGPQLFGANLLYAIPGTVVVALLLVALVRLSRTEDGVADGQGSR